MSDNLDLQIPTPLGAIKAAGSSVLINTLVGMLTLFVAGWAAFTIGAHEAQAQASAARTADVLEKSNQRLLETLEKNTAATVKALERVADEQKKATAATKEIACLNDPAMRNRGDAREFCKRMSSQ